MLNLRQTWTKQPALGTADPAPRHQRSVWTSAPTGLNGWKTLSENRRIDQWPSFLYAALIWIFTTTSVRADHVERRAALACVVPGCCLRHCCLPPPGQQRSTKRPDTHVAAAARRPLSAHIAELYGSVPGQAGRLGCRSTPVSSPETRWKGRHPALPSRSPALLARRNLAPHRTRPFSPQSNHQSQTPPRQAPASHQPPATAQHHCQPPHILRYNHSRSNQQPPAWRTRLTGAPMALIQVGFHHWQAPGRQARSRPRSNNQGQQLCIWR